MDFTSAKVAPEEATPVDEPLPSPGTVEKYAVETKLKRTSVGMKIEGKEEIGSYFRDAMTPVGFVSPNSDFQENWDVVLMACMVYVVIVTPFEVSFMGASSIDTGLFWFNRFIDLLFLIDMGLQFRTIPTEDGARALEYDENLGHNIAQRYFRGWFGIDLLSILPYDLMNMWAEDQEWARNIPLQLLRCVRLSRLAKILRVIRASRIVARYDDEIG